MADNKKTSTEVEDEAKLNKAQIKSTRSLTDALKDNTDSVNDNSDDLNKVSDDYKKVADKAEQSAKKENKVASQEQKDNFAKMIKEYKVVSLQNISNQPVLETAKLEDLTATRNLKSIEQLHVLEQIKFAAEDTGDIFKDEVSKKLSAKLADIAENVHDGSLKTLRADNLQLKTLEKTLNLIDDDIERELLSAQINQLKQMHKDNRADVGTLNSKIGLMGNAITGLGPIITGMAVGLLADSGLLGIGVAFAADALKGVIERKKERKIADAAMLREFKFAEAQKLATEQNATAIEVMEQSTIEELEKLVKQGEASPGSVSAEDISESNRRSNMQLDATEETNSVLEKWASKNQAEADEEKDGGFFTSLFKTFSGFSMAGLAAGFATFMGVLGTIATVIGTIIIPLVAIGNGIRNAFNDIMALPDGAGFAEIVLTGIRGLGEGILEVILGLPGRLIDMMFGTDITGFVKEQGGWTDTIANAIWTFVDSIGIIIGKGIDKLVQLFKDSVDTIFGFMWGIPAKIIDFLFGTDITGFVEDQGGWFETISNIFGIIGDAFDSALNWIEAKIRSIPFIGDKLANKFGFKKTNEELSDEELDESIAAQKTNIKQQGGPGFMNFLGSAIGVTDSVAEEAEKLLALEAELADRADLLTPQDLRIKRLAEGKIASAAAIPDTYDPSILDGEIEKKRGSLLDASRKRLMLISETDDVTDEPVKSERKLSRRMQSTFDRLSKIKKTQTIQGGAEFKDIKTGQIRNFSNASAQERSDGRVEKQQAANINAINTTTVNNLSRPVTNIQMTKTPRNDDISILALSYADEADY